MSRQPRTVWRGQGWWCFECNKDIFGSKYDHIWVCPATKFEPCGTYGCREPKPEGWVFCKTCQADYNEDPDAYK